MLLLKEKGEGLPQRCKGSKWEYDIPEEQQVAWGFKMPGMGNGMRWGWPMWCHEGYSDQNEECEVYSESSEKPL